MAAKYLLKSREVDGFRAVAFGGTKLCYASKWKTESKHDTLQEALSARTRVIGTAGLRQFWVFHRGKCVWKP